MRSTRLNGVLPVFAVACLVVLCGCVSVRQIRVQNISTRNFTNVSIAGQVYGNIAPGETSAYKSVKPRFGYVALKLHIDGKYVTGQTLHFRSKRFTYRIDVKDFDAGHLAIDIVRNTSSPDSG